MTRLRKFTFRVQITIKQRLFTACIHFLDLYGLGIYQSTGSIIEIGATPVRNVTG